MASSTILSFLTVDATWLHSLHHTSLLFSFPNVNHAFIISPMLRTISLPTAVFNAGINPANSSSSGRTGSEVEPVLVSAVNLSRITSGSCSFDLPDIEPLADPLADPRFDLGDSLFPSLDLTAVGDFIIVLITTGLDEGFGDEGRLDRSFLSCLHRSVPESVAGTARGLLSKSSLIGVKVGALQSSFPPLLLLFLPNVAVDSDEDWAVEGAASASSSSI